MGDCITADGKCIAILVVFLAIIISKSINDPDVASVVGDWFSALGDLLGAIGETDSLIQQKRQDREDLEKQIALLNDKLKRLK